MATSIGSLFVDLRLSTASFAQGLARARNLSLGSSRDIQRSLSLIGKAAAGIGISMAAGAAVLIKKSIDAADHLKDLSQQTGVSVRTLSSFKTGAEQSGTSIDDLASGIGKLNRAMFEAGSGSKEAAQLFKGLGVEFKNSDGSLRKSEDVLLDVAEKFSKMEDGAVKSALAVKLLGKAGANLIPFLNQGRAGLAAMADEARRLSQIIDDETATSADQFNDRLKTLQAAVEGFGLIMAKELLPVMNELAAALVEKANDANSLRSALQDLAQGVAFIIKVFAGLLAGLVAIGQVLGNVLRGFRLFTDSIRQGEFRRALDDLKLGFSDADDAALNFTKTLSAFAGLTKRPPSGLQQFISGAGSLAALEAELNSKFPKKFRPKASDFSVPKEGTSKKDIVGRELAELKERLAAEQRLNDVALQGEAIKRRAAALNEAEATITRLNVQLAEQKKAALSEENKELIRSTTLKISNAQADTAFKEGTKTLEEQAVAAEDLAYATGLGEAAIRKATIAIEVNDLVRKSGLELTKEQIALLEILITRQHDAAKLQAFKASVTDLKEQVLDAENLAAATAKGEAAVRKANIENELANRIRQAGIPLTKEQIANLEDLITRQYDAARAQQIENRAFDLDPVRRYTETLKELQEVLARHPELWRQVQQASDDAWREMIQNSREGSDGVRRALYDINRAAKDVAASMEALFKTAFSGLRESLIDIVAEGKLSFGDLGRELRRQIAGIALDKLVIGPLSGALGKIFGIPEAEKKPLGTASDPIHVTMAGIGGLFGGQQDLGLQSGSLEDQVAGILDQWGSAAQSTEGAFGKAAESTKSGFAGVLSSIAGSLKGLFGSILQGLSGALSGIGGFFSKIFGGGGTASLTSGLGGFIPFLAEGGISEAGHGIARSAKVAIFGEAGPEAFIPLKRGMVPLALGANGLSVALPGGRMIPASFEKFATGGIINEDRIRFNPRTPRGLRLMEDSDSSGGITVNQHWNITTPNADSFKQSQRQIQVTAFSAANRWTTRNNRK